MAVLPLPVSNACPPNRTCTFRYASGSPGTMANAGVRIQPPPEPLNPKAGKEELLSAILAPDLLGRTDQTRQSPNRRTFPVEAAVLLHEPAPQTIADIVVERRKELARSGTETVEVAQPRRIGFNFRSR